MDLCLSNCTWTKEIAFELYPWDAGTDDGVTYMVSVFSVCCFSRWRSVGCQRLGWAKEGWRLFDLWPECLDKREKRPCMVFVNCKYRNDRFHMSGYVVIYYYMVFSFLT